MFSGTETQGKRKTVSRGKVQRSMRRLAAVSQCPHGRGGAAAGHHLVSSAREMLCEHKVPVFPFTLWVFQVCIAEGTRVRRFLFIHVFWFVWDCCSQWKEVPFLPLNHFGCEGNCMTFSVCFESLRVGKYIRTIVDEASGERRWQTGYGWGWSSGGTAAGARWVGLTVCLVGEGLWTSNESECRLELVWVRHSLT